LPDRFTRREFGFLFFGQKFFLRHVGMPTQREFHQFLARRGPAHAYYSTAFYKTPNASTMQEKGWMGAELIFDLDADHVPGAEKLPYRQQLEKVKFHFLRLVEEFVIRDFGFEEKDLLLTFSGGRGYHCHVLKENALALDSVKRREIVDYITGTGLEPNMFLTTEVVKSMQIGARTVVQKSPRIPSKDAPGWGRRVNEVAVEYVKEMKGLDEAAFNERFKGLGRMGPKKLSDLRLEIQKLTTEQIERGFIDAGSALSRALPDLLRDQIVPLGKGETDEPVTSDTKRLIRLPGSLHGKSGLRVVTLKLDDVRGFDPLVDAVAFTDEPTRINVVKPSKVDVGGVQLDLPAGEATVPEAAAVMLVCRGAAVPV
jgi:DNA primase small subunit